jgi:hypothetical protein
MKIISLVVGVVYAALLISIVVLLYRGRYDQLRDCMLVWFVLQALGTCLSGAIQNFRIFVTS